MLAIALCGAAACDQLGLGPHGASSATAPPPSVTVPDLRPYAGRTYGALMNDPAMEQFSFAALGLSDQEADRVETAMATVAPASIAAGGGAEAIVFTGCAIGGCAEGRAVVAFDLSTGAAFVGVRDDQGTQVLAPNPRIEALLRLTSPTRDWLNPSPYAAPRSAAGP